MPTVINIPRSFIDYADQCRTPNKITWVLLPQYMDYGKSGVVECANFNDLRRMNLIWQISFESDDDAILFKLKYADELATCLF